MQNYIKKTDLETYNNNVHAMTNTLRLTLGDVMRDMKEKYPVLTEKFQIDDNLDWNTLFENIIKYSEISSKDLEHFNVKVYKEV
jgi:phage terminase small subunit